MSFGFQAEFTDNAITCLQEGKLQTVVDEDVSPESTAAPEPTLLPTPTSTPEVVPTTTPGVETEDEEDFNPETDAYIYHDVENRDWNMEMINADSKVVKDAAKHPKNGIRVALLDSGVNYSDEVYVTARKNFVPDEDEFSELYEDVSGHGTAIAEILASNPKGKSVELDVVESEESDLVSNGSDLVEMGGNFAEIVGEEDYAQDSLLKILDSGYEWNEGVNPSVDLISAKILDENNETTVNRVVEAIDWAIENDSDIISMSFGMTEDSGRLHKAIKKAKEAGILMIASVGNGEEVEYPAAYKEVMAVGAVDSLAERAEESAVGKEVEVVAPGEFVVSRGAFDSMQIFSGTSMAVPHVVGLASILWQKDTTKPAEFIRQLVNATAHELDETKEYGYGLIDCEYALEQYDRFEKLYQENECAVEEIENTEVIDTDEDVRKLYGNWEQDTHKAFVTSYAKKRDKVDDLYTHIKLLQIGVTCSDKKKNTECQGMGLHPWFHGFYGNNKIDQKTGQKHRKSNYIASYYYLYKLAEEMYKKGRLCEVDIDNQEFVGNAEVKNAYKGINEALSDSQVGSLKWGEISSACTKKTSNKERSLLLFGMAMHTVTDTYAHSTYSKESTGKKAVKWKAITHKKIDSATGRKRADSVKYVKRRYQDAKKVAHALMSRIRVDMKTGFKGFKSSDQALAVYTAPKYLYIGDNIIVKKFINQSFFDKAYALWKSAEYATQFENFVCQDNDKLKTNAKKVYDVFKKISVSHVQSISTLFTQIILSMKRPTLNGVKGELFSPEIKEKVGSAYSQTGEFALCVAKDIECKIKLTMADNSTSILCNVSNGKVYTETGEEIKEREIEEAEDEDEEEEDEEDVLQELCKISNVQYNMYNLSYRMELTWEDETMDLDSMLVGVYPEDEKLFLTYFVEKTYHPDLAEVFQSSEKASIDNDVENADGIETTPIYTADVSQGEGYFWHVFCILGNSGTIGIMGMISNNTFGYESDERG